MRILTHNSLVPNV